MHRLSDSRTALLLAALACIAVADSAPLIAARIDGEDIPVASVDALSMRQVQHVRRRLLDVAHAALEQIVDARLSIDRLPASLQSQQRARLYREREVKFLLPEPRALETKLPDELTIAWIGDQRIAAAVLEEAAALKLYRLRGELYLQRRRNVEILIEQQLLELAAQDRGISVVELQKALSRSEPVTDSELHEYVAGQRAAGRTIENPERVRPYLEFQRTHQRRSDLMQSIRARTRVEIELQPPLRPQLLVNTAGGVLLGASSGPTLVVYTNYVCAICRATHLELDRLRAGRKPPRIVLRDFVNDSAAVDGSAAVRCAARSGRTGLVRKHLLARRPPAHGQPWFDTAALKAVANLAKMSVTSLRACMDSQEIRDAILRDTREAQRLGFDDPPAFVAAGVPLSGMQDAEQLAAALKTEWSTQSRAQ